MFTIKAPAKINWFLRILYRRDDGFHEIRSMIQKVSLFDELTFSPGKDITVVTDSNIPLHDNLVYKAAKRIQETHSVSQGAEIHLTKNIPVEAGLGGGSSDAAAALLGLNRLWSLELSYKELHHLGESLGSDVPFFLYDSLGYVTGRGENIKPYTAKMSFPVLLVKPSVSVSTAWAYKNRVVPETEPEDNSQALCELIEKGDITGLTLYNDLEKAVINHYQIIGEIKEKMKRQNASAVLMSGSGSTVFGVFSSTSSAQKASDAFPDSSTFVVETLM